MSKLEQIGPNASSWPMGLRIFQSDKTATFVVQHWPSHGQGWHDMKAHLSPWFLCVVVAATGCRPEPLEVFGMEDIRPLPSHFPNFQDAEDNPLNEAKWELGRHLFFDTRLSADGQLSCASCHQPELAFADDVALSVGSEGAIGFRNAPGLFNLAWQPRFHREGGIPSLEAQVLAPIQDPLEFNQDPVALVDVLATDLRYQSWAQEGFGRPFDGYVMTRALAAFERTLVSGNSPWDRWLQGDPTAMTASALRGMELFDDSGCGGCHPDLWATDFATHNNGLYEQYINDRGAFRLTFDSTDIGAFKTPSLRNLAFTAPYMFDGSLSTLTEVINHYASGGSGHPNQDVRIAPLKLSSQERADLEAFLMAMSDTSFVQWATSLRP